MRTDENSCKIGFIIGNGYEFGPISSIYTLCIVIYSSTKYNIKSQFMLPRLSKNVNTQNQ